MNPAAENVLIRQTAAQLHRKHFGKLLIMSLLWAGLCLAILAIGLVILFVTTGGPWSSTAKYTSFRGVNEAFRWGMRGLLLLIILAGSGSFLGLISALLDVCRGNGSIPAGCLFSRTKYSLKAFALNLWSSAAIFLWMLPGFLLMWFGSLIWAVCIDSVTGELALTPNEQQIIGGIILLGLVLFITPAIPAVLRHMLAPVILADEPTNGVWDCAARSKAMMKGRKWQLFRLLLPILLVFSAVLLALSALGDLGLRTFRSDLASGLINTLQPILCLGVTLLFSVHALLCLCLFYLLRKDAAFTPCTSAGSSAAITNEKAKETDHEEPVR